MADKPGRPQKEINEDLLKKLTKLHLSDKVIADCLGVHVDTLHNRFSEQMEQWRSESKGKIAEVLFDEAVNKREPWALKALAQKHLDYSDRVRSTVGGDADSPPISLESKQDIDYIKLAQLVRDAKGE